MWCASGNVWSHLGVWQGTTCRADCCTGPLIKINMMELYLPKDTHCMLKLSCLILFITINLCHLLDVLQWSLKSASQRNCRFRQVCLIEVSSAIALSDWVLSSRLGVGGFANIVVTQVFSTSTVMKCHEARLRWDARRFCVGSTRERGDPWSLEWGWEMVIHRQVEVLLSLELKMKSEQQSSEESRRSVTGPATDHCQS